MKLVGYLNILKVDLNHIELIRQWRNSSEVKKYMYKDHYISKEEHMKWYYSLKLNKTKRKVWVIFYDEVPVGVIYLSEIDHKNKVTDWGLYIGETAYRGLGIGSISLYRLMEYVFDKMNFHKMYTSVLENNPDALNLYKKFGFKEEGRLRKHILRDGKYIDVSLIGILNEEWKDIKNSLPIINRIKESYEIK